tara:strand:- start:52 stop:681 length:630 start_codon:yes stop_codon:yes gene_type:complete
MSRIRANQITNKTASGAPTVQNGLVVTGVTTSTNVSVASSVTAATFHGNGAGLTNVSGGKLLQVVMGYDTNFVRASTSSSTYVATNHAVTITPTAANSKIFFTFTGDANTNGNNNYIHISVFRSVNGGSYTDLSQLGQSGGNNNGFTTVNGTGQRIEVPFTINFLDTPTYSLGNAITYKIYFKGSGSGLEIPSSGDNQPVIGIARELAA